MFIEKFTVDSNNLLEVEPKLTYNKVHTLIIENIISQTVIVSNIEIEKLIIRNVKDTSILLDRCIIKLIDNEDNPDTKLRIKFCRANAVLGNYGRVHLSNSELNYSKFSTEELFSRSGDIRECNIDIKKNIELYTNSTIQYSNINLLGDSSLRSNVIIYNKVGGRKDNLIIFKKSKLVNTGCFHNSIYEFIIKVYDALNENKYYYSKGNPKAYEEYLNIIDKHSEELFSSKELLVYKTLKIMLRLYYRFNNPYK